ncbi:hypothetical protein TCSYLVIO_004495 [Trypanosoma cruzi]|nr:hypothetical protein TCSYLVIO_004495 [Trypanosoma cruzi]
MPRTEGQEEVGTTKRKKTPGDPIHTEDPWQLLRISNASSTSAAHPSQTLNRSRESDAAAATSSPSESGSGDGSDGVKAEGEDFESEMSDIDRYCQHAALFSNSRGVDYFLNGMPSTEPLRRRADDHQFSGGEYSLPSQESETLWTNIMMSSMGNSSLEAREISGDDATKAIVACGSPMEREAQAFYTHHRMAPSFDETTTNTTVGTDECRSTCHTRSLCCQSLIAVTLDSNGSVDDGNQKGKEDDNLESPSQHVTGVQTEQTRECNYLTIRRSGHDMVDSHTTPRRQGCSTLHDRRHQHHRRQQQEQFHTCTGSNVHFNAKIQDGAAKSMGNMRQDWRHQQNQGQQQEQRENPRQRKESQEGSFSSNTVTSLFPSLPTFSPTSFVRAYVGEGNYPWEATLDNRPALTVSCCVAAMNWVVVQFLQYHVLDTRDHLGLFVIGTYIIFSSYYMTYYFLERYSLSFARISHDKKFYTIANLIKAGILVSLVPFATSHLGNIIMFDVWDTNTLRNLGCIYTIPDFVSMIVVKRMSWSTWIHHLCVLLFNFFSTTNDYSQENICRCVVVYAAFSTFAYCVNVLLASRFLGVSPNVARVLSVVAVVVYIFCCATNWAWQVYYLRKLIRDGHGHWTVYAYMPLMFLVMYDDITLSKWLLHNAKSTAFAAANYREHQHRQQQQQQQQQQMAAARVSHRV